MKIAFVGCGFVFDIYMRTIRAHPELTILGVFDIDTHRMAEVSKFYGLSTYSSLLKVLEDPDVDAVINLTSIPSHFEVSKLSLESGKHVYSEKPVTTSLEEARKLFDIAKANKVRLYAAPCNIFSDSIRTILKTVSSNIIGPPLLVYAELDDNPIHHMDFEKVVSPSGAPWPLKDEIYEGCTYEHIAYHLIWICALLGPAKAITAYSSELIKQKMDNIPALVGTPDYSVANIHFSSGASARITCSVVAPRDHRMRVICRDGEISCDGYRQFRAPVYLERFTKGSLTARKFQLLRTNPRLGKLFGIGGRRIRLVTNPKTIAVQRDQQLRSSLKQRLIELIRRREVYAQDKFVGISEMSREIKADIPQFLTPEFIMHVNELTFITQNAGTNGVATVPSTTFSELGSIPNTFSKPLRARLFNRPRLLEKLISR